MTYAPLIRSELVPDILKVHSRLVQIQVLNLIEINPFRSRLFQQIVEEDRAGDLDEERKASGDVQDEIGVFAQGDPRRCGGLLYKVYGFSLLKGSQLEGGEDIEERRIRDLLGVTQLLKISP